MKTNSSKERVQLDFIPDELKEIDDAKVKLGFATRAEFLRRALRLYVWFGMKVPNDAIIRVEDSEGNTLFRIHKDILI